MTRTARVAMSQTAPVAMTRTARVDAVPKSPATLVATAVPVALWSTAALLGLAVVRTLPDRRLGLPRRIASVAISIPVLVLGRSVADTQTTTVALRASVPVVGNLLVRRRRIAPSVGDGRTRAAERAAVLALVLAWLRCQDRMSRSRFYPRLKQRHHDQCQPDPQDCVPKPVGR